MKTNNYEIELMLPMQEDKEVVFNEALVILDKFCNYSVIDFIDNIPDTLDNNEKYIISAGDYKNNICFIQHVNKKIKLITPQEGMIIFIKNKRNFFIFEKNQWLSISDKG